MRALILTVAVVACAFLQGCCCISLENRLGPGLTIHVNKIGTGEQAIEPTNDDRFWNGEPMDLRRDR